ncbi:hypothetical protein EJB05_10239, partial [Eragrostis curvula]
MALQRSGEENMGQFLYLEGMEYAMWNSQLDRRRGEREPLISTTTTTGWPRTKRSPTRHTTSCPCPASAPTPASPGSPWCASSTTARPRTSMNPSDLWNGSYFNYDNDSGGENSASIMADRRSSSGTRVRAGSTTPSSSSWTGGRRQATVLDQKVMRVNGMRTIVTRTNTKIRNGDGPKYPWLHQLVSNASSSVRSLPTTHARILRLSMAPATAARSQPPTMPPDVDFAWIET